MGGNHCVPIQNSKNMTHRSRQRDLSFAEGSHRACLHSSCVLKLLLSGCGYKNCNSLLMATVAKSAPTFRGCWLHKALGRPTAFDATEA